MKILYIPADNISANFSRSYHIAKNLSKHCDLYRVIWEDNRSAFWEGKKVSLVNGLKCFLKSLFQKYQVKPSSDFGFDVHCSVFISAFIGRIVGRYTALKIMRSHNRKTLTKLVNRINPDVIFHADGYYFFPALNKDIPEFSDLQDDINWSNIPENKLQAARAYYTKHFNVSKINFIVSESAKKSINEYIKSDFLPISNGADFSTISTITNQSKLKFKSKFKIDDSKQIASYIGGEHKFDIEFTKKLVEVARTKCPNLVFVLAGNLPVFKSSNVIFTGIISNNDANILYGISDIGLTLKNTLNNDFIYNSVPLKFIQYAAAKKPVVSFPIKWSIDKQFNNIKHVSSENTEEWINAIQKQLEFKWDNQTSNQWEAYDWSNIAKEIYDIIISNT